MFETVDLKRKQILNKQDCLLSVKLARKLSRGE